MVETNNNTTEYIKVLRERAVALDNDKYLLKLADAVEQNKGVLSATIELAVASRIQALFWHTFLENKIIDQTIQSDYYEYLRNIREKEIEEQ